MPERDLVGASAHLLYEGEMLEATRRVLASGVTAGSLLNNAVLESFLVHARNLVHFFYPQNPFKTDVLAEHYFESGQWDSIRPEMPEPLEKIRTRANKELAHLTYERLSVMPKEKHWYFDEIHEAIIHLLRVFTDNVDVAKLHADWDAALGRIQQEPTE